MARSGSGSGSPALQRHPERQRRISVKIASDSNVGKYQSAGRRFPVFPKVDAASPRGLMAPPGLTALGAKGSVRNRLTPPGRVEGSRPRELYNIAALARWAPFWGAPFFMPPLAAKTGQPPCGRGNASPLWWLAPPPFPRKRWHYNAPLCCELLMKGLLFRALFCPRLRGKSGTAG